MHGAVTTPQRVTWQKAPGFQGAGPLVPVRWSGKPWTVLIHHVGLEVRDVLDTTRNTLGVRYMAQAMPRHAHSTCTIGSVQVPNARCGIVHVQSRTENSNGALRGRGRGRCTDIQAHACPHGHIRTDMGTLARRPAH